MLYCLKSSVLQLKKQDSYHDEIGWAAGMTILVIAHIAGFDFSSYILLHPGEVSKWCACTMRLTPAVKYLNNCLHLRGAGEGWWGAARSLPKLSCFNSHRTDSTQWTLMQAGTHSAGLWRFYFLKRLRKSCLQMKYFILFMYYYIVLIYSA